MGEKMPDSYVPDRKLKAYPTELGSLKHHFSSKFEEIQKEYQKLINEISINERLYLAKHNFEPISGHKYFLYEKDGSEFLSIISPAEWGNKYKFIGKFQFLSDGRWVED